MEIQENLIQITGKAWIEYPLEQDTEYQIVGVVTTYGKDVRSKQDGDTVVTHKAKFSDAVTLIKGDKVVLGKKEKRTNSQKLRQAIFVRGHDYDEFMKFLFNKLDDLFYEYETK